MVPVRAASISTKALCLCSVCLSQGIDQGDGSSERFPSCFFADSHEARIHEVEGICAKKHRRRALSTRNYEETRGARGRSSSEDSLVYDGTDLSLDMLPALGLAGHRTRGVFARIRGNCEQRQQ